MSSRGLERLTANFARTVKRIEELEASGKYGSALTQFKVCVSESSRIQGLLAESESGEQSAAAVAAAAIVEQVNLDSWKLALESGARTEVAKNKLCSFRRKANRTLAAAKAGAVPASDASTILSEILDEATNLLDDMEESDHESEKMYDELIILCSLWGEGSASPASRPTSVLSLSGLQLEEGDTARGQPERPATPGATEAKEALRVTEQATTSRDELVQVLRQVVETRAPDPASCPQLPVDCLEFESWASEVRLFRELHNLTSRQMMIVLLDPRVIADINLRASLHGITELEKVFEKLRGQLLPAPAIPRSVMAKWVNKSEPPYTDYLPFMRELRRDLQRINMTDIRGMITSWNLLKVAASKMPARCAPKIIVLIDQMKPDSEVLERMESVLLEHQSYIMSTCDEVCLAGLGGGLNGKQPVSTGKQPISSGGTAKTESAKHSSSRRDRRRAKERANLAAGVNGQPGTARENSRPCAVASCGGNHVRQEDCAELMKLSPQERSEAVKCARRCYNCLKTGHMVRDCRSQHACKVEGCRKRHHTILHFPTEPSSTDGGDQAPGERRL